MHVVAEQMPVGEGEAFTGVVDLVAGASGDGNAAAARGKLLEALGDFDDHLLEELLDGVEPPLDEVRRDLHDEYARDLIVPVLFGSAARGIGISELIAVVVDQFPSPLDVPRHDVEGRPVEPKPGGPVVAQVCKTMIHPQSGKLSVVRVFSGTLTSDTVLTDTSRTGVQSRPGGIYVLQGKKQEPVASAGPGDIVALSRLDGVHTLDTLASGGARTVMPALELSEPVFAVAIAPKDRLDEAKLSQMLARLIDEDPSLRLMRAEFTNELELCGCGEVHVAIAAERLARKYHVAVETRAPQIAYRETIAAGTEAHARYKHQTGGHGQFGEVRLRIEPRERGHGVSFEEKVVGGAVPRQFYPAVEKGVREALMRGPSGFPVTDLHVTLYDGSFHAVDSSEAAFKTAASMAIRDALPKCGVVLLEPVVQIDVLVPETFASATVSQLTAKRGIVQSFGPAEDGTAYRVAALVPQAELATYITELRTATQGLGSFRSRHERFDPVPPKIGESLRVAAPA
jgi:elongation factor G